MKITISNSYEYGGRDSIVLPVESFDLTVEGGDADEDNPKTMARTYLELRKVLKDGIKEGK